MNGGVTFCVAKLVSFDSVIKLLDGFALGVADGGETGSDTASSSEPVLGSQSQNASEELYPGNRRQEA